VSITVIITHWHIQGAEATKCDQNTNNVSNFNLASHIYFLTCPVCFLKTVLKIPHKIYKKSCKLVMPNL